MFIENVWTTLLSSVGTICLLPCDARTYRPYQINAMNARLVFSWTKERLTNSEYSH